MLTKGWRAAGGRRTTDGRRAVGVDNLLLDSRSPVARRSFAGRLTSLVGRSPVDRRSFAGRLTSLVGRLPVARRAVGVDIFLKNDVITDK